MGGQNLNFAPLNFTKKGDFFLFFFVFLEENLLQEENFPLAKS